MIVNNRTARVIVAVAVSTAAVIGSAPTYADEPALRLRAAIVGSAQPLTVDVLRWSTDQERASLLAALSAPPPAARGAAAPAAGRGRRGARGGRGAAPPLSPAARLSAAVKAAPTVGFIWGDGPTGYAIKYAWRDASSGALGRVVLVTDRRLGAHSPSWPPVSVSSAGGSADADPLASAARRVAERPDLAKAGTASDVEFTVVELRLDAKGLGEGKASFSNPVVDPAAQTLALDGYTEAPLLLEVSQ